MSANTNVAVAVAPMTLNQRVLSLSVAQGVDYGVQLLLPVVLVRCLDSGEFGQYRLLWLVVGTILAFANCSMPTSLLYFLPRSDRATQRLYVNQTLIFLAATGLVASIFVGLWNAWMPETTRGLNAHAGLVAAFVLLWVVASMLDLLPTADERVGWQARATIGLATLRGAALSATAILTGDLGSVLVALVAFVVFKLGVLITYVARHHGLAGPVLRWSAFRDQVKYAAPFGVSGALYMFRVQGDQWIAATLFSLGMFASFSIAAVLEPFLNVVRHAASLAFLPSMSGLHKRGDLRGALALNSRANVMVAAVVFPVLAFVFAFAEDLITVVYTAAYVDAAPVMRVYIVGLAALVVELATVTFVLRQGAFMLGLNFVTLVCSVALSWYAARRFGLAGAALGSVTAACVDRIVILCRVSRIAETPIRRLQNWRALGLLLLLAGLAAELARGIAGAYFGQDGPLVRSGAGGAILALGYGAMYLYARKVFSKVLRWHEQGG